MDPFVKKANLSFKVGIVVITGIVVIAGVSALIWGGINFMDYRGSGGLPPIASSPAQVAISEPQNGAQIEMGESVIVFATALGPNEFLSMELWLDGELAGVQAAPQGGMHPFSTHFSWLPIEPGLHALIAAAVDGEGNKTMSAQVVVLITEAEAGIDFAEIKQENGLPIVVPGPPEGGSLPPEGPGAGASTGPAGNWGGTPGNWLNSLTEKEKPAAPELVVEVDNCAANLQIHDLSDNEEGFVVYRQMTNSPAWLKVATLSSQSQVDWITYLDQGVYGAVTYYISAFNNQGEAESNLALVNIDPAGCDGENAGISATNVDLTLQFPDNSADKVYCYQSTNGVNWSRWPRTGFLTMDENGFLPEGTLITHRNLDFAGFPVDLIDGLFLECWGWQGGALIPIGDLSVGEITPDLAGRQKIVGEGIAAELALIPANLVNLGDLFPIGGGGPQMADFQVNPMQFNQQKLTPISPDIPTATLSLTTDREECGKFVPPDALNPLGKLLYCFPYPEFDLDKGGIRPQPYLIWKWNPLPQCIGGHTDVCKTYVRLLELAQENGGQIGYELIAISSKGKHTWTVTEPFQRMFVVPPVTCVGDMDFNFRMWYQPGNKGVAVSASPGDQITEIGDFKPLPPGEIFYGPYSNTVSVPCLPYEMKIGEQLTTERQYLDVTFESIELFEIDDDDLREVQDIEVYGYFKVFAPSMGRLKNPICILDDFPGACDDSPLTPFDDPYIADRNRYALVTDWESVPNEYSPENDPGDNPHLESGFYELKDWPLCQSTNKYGCHYEGVDTSYIYNNNTVRVFVTDGDSLSFGATLIDYDEASSDDFVCNIFEDIPSKTLEKWASIKNETYVLHSPMYSSGRCIVNVIINAVNP